VGKERTDAVKHSHKVHVEHPSPIFERNVVDASEAADTRIVANHMDFAECLVRRLGRTLDAIRIGNVTGNATHIRSKFVEIFDSNRQRVLLDIGEHDFHARVDKDPTKREPNATRSACYESCLAGQIPHDLSLPPV
jgi:hypothetical protein